MTSYALAGGSKVLLTEKVWRGGKLLQVDYFGLTDSTTKIQSFVSTRKEGPFSYLGADYDLTLDSTKPTSHLILTGIPEASYVQFKVVCNAGTQGTLNAITTNGNR